jgi:hypothetical protein
MRLLLALLLLATPAAAQVRQFANDAPTPAFAGTRFGDTGAYEVVRSRATIALDPADRRNAAIADIAAAPRNAEGRVEAEVDVLILRPADPARANGTLLLEAVNRGRPLVMQLLNDTPGARTGRTETAADAGNAWLFRQGYTLAFVGWQGDYTAEAGLRISAPLVAGVTGRVREEFVFDNTTNPVAARLTYPVADPASLTITARARSTDERATPPGLAVRLTAPDRIEITRPPGLDAGAIFEAIYTARDPIVLGMGLAGFRDVAAALRHNEGANNPLAGRTTQRVVATGISQSGRFLRDLLHQGFAEDTAGRAAFDALVPHIAGSRRTYINARWAQPGRNPSDHTDRLYPADQFPFTYADTTDPLTGATDGLLRRCTATSTCPRIMQTDSEFEFWGARGSLTVTDAGGRHIELPPNVRAYMFAGHPHFAAADAWAAQGRLCAMPINPLQAGAPMRALFVALEAWMREGAAPPASRVPTLADGTLVQAVAWPAIPGLREPASLTPAPLLDLSVLPPRVVGAYPFFVPRLDADGHAVGGIRLPVIEAPRATYTGFNPRAEGFAPGALCTNQGGVVPLPAARLADDPRRPLAERYADDAAYVAAVQAAAARLVGERLLLPEDAAAMVAAARAGTLARLR